MQGVIVTLDHSDTPYLVGHLWTRHRFVEETYT